MKKPYRVFIKYFENPCIELREAANTLLYTLLVSHGIRVDTSLYIVSMENTWVFHGEELRHLYPQEKSLHGFTKTIFCKNKLLPGVYLVEAIELKGDYCLIYPSINQGYTVLDKPPSILEKVDTLVIVLDRIDSLKLSREKHYCIIYARTYREKPIEYTITSINYLLDAWFGARIRRKGVIIEYEGYYRRRQERSSYST